MRLAGKGLGCGATSFSLIGVNFQSAITSTDSQNFHRQGRSQDFHQGGAQLESEVTVVCGEASAWPALLAIGDGCGRGYVPSRWRREAFGISSFTAINFHWFSCVLSSIDNWAQPLEGCHAILWLFSSHLLFMNVALLLIYSLGLEGCWSACSFNLRARNMAHSSVLTGLLSCYTVVRYAHAPKSDHTPIVRTLNFDICLHKRCLCQGK